MQNYFSELSKTPNGSQINPPNTVVKPYPNPKNSPLGPRKVKNNPKIKSKSNARIEGNKENENNCTI